MQVSREATLATVLCMGILYAGTALAQETPRLLPKKSEPLALIGAVGDGVVFFTEDGNDPDTGEPLPTPSEPLEPITSSKVIEVETGSAVLPGGTVKDLLQVDVHLRQRYFYRNDGQDRVQVFSNPFLQIESPVFDDLTDPVSGQPMNGVWRFAVLGNGLHLATTRPLAEGEVGNESRGNFGRVILTAGGLDERFGDGIGKRVFSQDLTLRLSVFNRVQGVEILVVGTFSQVYGH